jgi:hypothetical protein
MNEHIKDYLSYFKKLDAPGYAVLVTGAWGVGKTYQVRAAFKPEEYYYVTVNGLKSAAEIHASVLGAAMPKTSRAKTFFSKAEGAAGKLPGFIGAGAILLLNMGSAGLSKLLNVNFDPSKVLVFDDLERSSMPREELLGAINAYVEQGKLKVVAIAHDTKLTDFSDRKEKTFGYSLMVEPATSEAFDSFVSALHYGVRHNIAKLKVEIIQVFDASGAGTLRILRQLLQDIARVFELLPPRQLNNAEAMRDFVRFFSALNIEVRLTRMEANDLVNRRERAITAHMAARRDGTTADKGLIAAQQRYPMVNLEDTILSDEALVEMLIKGRYDSAQIIASLDATPWFRSPTAAPPWKRLIEFDRSDDAAVDSAIAEIDISLASGTITRAGEIIHTACLVSLLSSTGHRPQTFDQIESFFVEYIDRLYALGRLDPNDNLPEGRTGYGGYSFWLKPEFQPHLNKIMSALKRLLSQCRDDQLAELAPAVLEQLSNDGYGFYSLLCYNAVESPYADRPILSAIEPAKFVATWLAAPRTVWDGVRRVFEERYRPNKLQGALAKEAPWLQEVQQIIQAEINKLTGLQRYRLERAASTLFAIQLPPIVQAAGLTGAQDHIPEVTAPPDT